MAVTRDGEQVGGGIVITPTRRRGRAGSCSPSCTGCSQLAGGQVGITVSDEDYAGTTITTIHLGDLKGVEAFAGAAPGPTSASRSP